MKVYIVQIKSQYSGYFENYAAFDSNKQASECIEKLKAKYRTYKFDADTNEYEECKPSFRIDMLEIQGGK